MITVDESRWAEIRRLFHHEKMRRRAIARHLHISRDTVDTALASDRCPKRVSAPRGSILDPYQEAIQGILAQYPKLSAIRVFEKIRDLGYPGKITVVCDYLQKVRPRRPPEAFLKRETLPGVEAQADWGSCGHIAVDGTIRPLSVFVMALSFSRMLYVEFTVSQEMEDFLRCHVNAFGLFKGCPKVILYDNLKSVVLWRQGRLKRFNARFQEFAGTYLFEARPCSPARGNEKPRAETGVRYVKQNFLAGREFRDLNDLRIQAYHWLKDVANVRIHGTTGERPADRWEREKPHLQGVPPTPYDTRITRAVGVNHQTRVEFQTNTYTVPPRFVGQTLTLKAGPDRVTLYHGDTEVASHVRSYGRRKDVEDPVHTKAILATKRAGRADKQRDEFLALGPQADRFFEGLVERGHGSPDHHVERILDLVQEYGTTPVLAALERAIAFGAFGADYVQHILVQRCGEGLSTQKPDPLSLSTRPDLAVHTVEVPDLSEYSDLTDMEDDDGSDPSDGSDEHPQF